MHEGFCGFSLHHLNPYAMLKKRMRNSYSTQTDVDYKKEYQHYLENKLKEKFRQIIPAIYKNNFIKTIHKNAFIRTMFRLNRI
jgi:hypothetical protein